MYYRKESIDNMKGFLTALMILSHVSNVCIGKVELFSVYINLTTFSGFMFCFGYSVYVAYIIKASTPIKKLMSGAIKLFAAYYISTSMYFIIVDRSIEQFISCLLQINLSGYAEFLISWAYLYILLIPCIPIIKKTVEHDWIFIIVILLSLFATKVQYDRLTIPWLGPIIGRSEGTYFPIIQYSSYFMAGVYVARYKIVFNWKMMMISIFSAIYFFVYTYVNGFPARWKPHAGWIIGGYFFIYIYYIVFELIESRNVHCKIMNFIGRNSLMFLLLSNFFIFLMKHLKVNEWEIIIMLKILFWYVVTMILCTSIVKLKQIFRFS